MSKKYSHIKQYEKEIVPAMMKKFNYKSIMEVPKLDKIVINIGLGDTKENPKELDNAIADLSKITGQKSKKTICRNIKQTKRQTAQKRNQVAAIHSAIKQVDAITV